jgi:hypothetical protein
MALSWTYSSNACDDEFAMHNGYRIRAEREQGGVPNPFKDEDGHWPISVRSPDNYRSCDFTDYDGAANIRCPLARFTDPLIIHWQVHIAKVLDTTVQAALIAYWSDDGEAPAYSDDADALRQAFDQVLENEIKNSNLFDRYVELYKLLDIMAVASEQRGHCQGDYCEVLVVAPPEVIAQFGATSLTEQHLQDTADLYGYWAWGECFRYVVEAPSLVDEDGDVIEWEEVEDGSCGTYFGDDHAASGLEESALGCVPEEAPTPEVQEYA